MGKWSPNYTDDLLQTKISTLVTGALRRAAVDNDATIGNLTYENFVQDLDTGDSFAATMIDILVKELAERRVRHQADRRFISPRTMKSLRQLATPLNQYPPRMRGPHASRRPMITEHTMFDDDDNFSLMMEDTEGVHMSSADLYDAMSIPWPRRASEEPGSSSVRTTAPPLTVRSPPANARPPWSVLPQPSALPITLTRQASIRRPFNNSRNIEFNNYTRRHRSSHREGLDGEGAESVTEPRDADDPHTRFPSTTSAARRFFPPMTARRLRRNGVNQPPGAQRLSTEMSDGTSSGEEDALLLANRAEQFAAYVTNPSTLTVATPAPGSIEASGAAPPDAGDDWVPGAPRLPMRVFAPRVRAGLARSIPSPGPEVAATTSTVAPSSAPLRSIIADDILGEAAAYPTPGSTEGEHLT